jgi:DNA-binding NtrC family response regulator
VERGVRAFVNSRRVKTPVILLVTSDPRLEDSVAQALSEIGGLSHLTGSPSKALDLVCTISQDLDLAVIDCEEAPHRLTLLAPIKGCRGDLPVIAVTRDEDKKIEALAYVNGASTCLSKPVSAAQVARAIKQCRPSAECKNLHSSKWFSRKLAVA